MLIVIAIVCVCVPGNNSNRPLFWMYMMYSYCFLRRILGKALVFRHLSSKQILIVENTWH
jgi:hypothetical protein